MRKATLLLLLVGAAAWATDRQLEQRIFIQRLNGSPARIGILSSTDAGSFSNSTTDQPDGGYLLSDAGFTGGNGAFDAGPGDIYYTQCRAAVYFAVGSSASVYDTKLAADEKFWFTLGTSQSAIAVKPVSGTCVPCCSVFKPE